MAPGKEVGDKCGFPANVSGPFVGANPLILAGVPRKRRRVDGEVLRYEALNGRRIAGESGSGEKLGF